MNIDEVKPIRVLLVDDHRSVLWGLGKLIESASPQMQVVGTATNCTQALSEIDEHQPDVVLLDVVLEEGSGLDLLNKLAGRNRPNVVILTGFRDSEVLESAILAGARGAVYKSETADSIIDAIICVHGGGTWLPRAAIVKVFATAFASQRNGRAGVGAREIDSLTPAERRVIMAVVQHGGASGKVIAKALHISSNTLRNHLASIYSKTGVHSRLDLILYAKECGLDKNAAIGH